MKKFEDLNKKPEEEIPFDDYEILIRYNQLLQDYKSKWEEVRRFKRLIQKNPNNNEIATAIQVIDEERHNIHLEMIEVASRLGIDKKGVLGDILHGEKNLEEYGLPDFAVFSSSYVTTDIELEADCIYLIYDIQESDIDGGSRQEHGNWIVPRINSIIRAKRIFNLSRKLKKLNVYTSSYPDAFTHDTYNTFCCLEVPDQNIEAFADFVKNHDEFRVDPSFFTKEEIEVAKEDFKKEIIHFLLKYVKNDKAMVYQMLEKFRKEGNIIEKEIVFPLVEEHLQKISLN